MTKYEYRRETFGKLDEAAVIPDDAIGATVDYFGSLAVVQYLQPISE